MASVCTIFDDTDPTIRDAIKQSLSDMGRIGWLTVLTQQIHDVTVVIP